MELSWEKNGQNDKIGRNLVKDAFAYASMHGSKDTYEKDQHDPHCPEDDQRKQTIGNVRGHQRREFYMSHVLCICGNC